MISDEQERMLDIVAHPRESIEKFKVGGARRAEKELAAIAQAKLQVAREVMSDQYQQGSDERASFANELLAEARRIATVMVKDHFAEIEALADSPEADLPADVPSMGMREARRKLKDGGRMTRAGELKARAKTLKRGLAIMRDYDHTVMQLRQTHPKLPWEPAVTVGVKLDGYADMIRGEVAAVDGEVVDGGAEFERFLEQGDADGEG